MTKKSTTDDSTYIKDAYWEYDAEKHFRPHVNKGDFMQRTGDDLLYWLREPLAAAGGGRFPSTEKFTSLSYGQKLLVLYITLHEEVMNGGFEQFWGNRNGALMPAIINGFRYTGDKKMLEMLLKANEYNEKRQYGRLDQLTMKYYKIEEEVRTHLENYIRMHPSEFCLDEKGHEIEAKLPEGTSRIYHPNGKVKEEYTLVKGKKEGPCRIYREDGTLKETEYYKKGKKTEERERYDEQGVLKDRCLYDEATARYVNEEFYPDGVRRSLMYNIFTPPSRGYTSPNYTPVGPRFDWWPDGSPLAEGEYTPEGRKEHKCWNEKGEQILTDGTGLYISFYRSSLDDDPEEIRFESEYKEYKLHGVSHTYKDDRVTDYKEYKMGVLHGLSRKFYNNGRLKLEEIYDNGKVVSSKKFPKYEHQVIKTRVEQFRNDPRGRDAPVRDDLDCYPVLLNPEVAQQIPVEPGWLKDDGEDQVTEALLQVKVDATGVPTKAECYYHEGIRYLLKTRDLYEDNARELRFSPAMKDGKPVAVATYIVYTHWLGE